MPESSFLQKSLRILPKTLAKLKEKWYNKRDVNWRGGRVAEGATLEML